MANLIDWSLDTASIRKQLIHLPKPKLIKLCKFKRVSFAGTKKDIIKRLLSKQQKHTKPNPNQHKKQTETNQHHSPIKYVTNPNKEDSHQTIQMTVTNNENFQISLNNDTKVNLCSDKNTNNSDIRITIYSKNHHICTSTVILSSCAIFLYFFFGFAIIASIGYGASLIFEKANDIKQYGKSFNIKGKCHIIDSYKHSYGCGNEKSYTCYTTHYKYQIYEATLCQEYESMFDKSYTLEKGSYDIGDIIACYTNQKCDTIVTDTDQYSKEKKTTAGFTTFGAVIVCIVAICCCAPIIFGCFQTYIYLTDSDNDCIKYITGRDKNEYYMEQWNNVMNKNQRIDYFMSFHLRKYGMYLFHRTMHKTLSDYVE